jgi:uncharacterized lipoprotein YehR (DUF1307 family)
MALRDEKGRRFFLGGAIDPIGIASIAITTEPTNTQYAGNALDLTGLVITATKNDGTTEVVTNKVICNRDKWGGAVPTTVTFGYHEKACYWTVTPTAVVPASIAVKTAPTKTAYKYGETIDLTGCVIEVTYNDSHKEDKTSGFTCSPTTMGADTSAITISYTEDEVTKTTTQAVTLIAPDSASIETPAEKLTYVAGEEVDLTGLTLEITYDDESTAVVSSGFTASPTEVSAETTSITVTYTEGDVSVSTGYDITVTEG